MRVIIAGGRDIVAYDQVAKAVLESRFRISEVVSGHYGCVDLNGERWADRHGVPVKLFPPDWKAFGPSAGPRRNSQMADYAEALVLVWDGKSKGSTDMRNKAMARGLKIHERIIGVLVPRQKGKKNG